MGIPTLRKQFTAQNIYTFLRFLKHFYLTSCFPSSHILNVGIYNCEDAVMCCLDAPSDKKNLWLWLLRGWPATSHLQGLSQPWGPCAAVTSLTDWKVKPSRPDSAQLWRGIHSSELPLDQLKWSCTPNFPAARSCFIPVFPPESTRKTGLIFSENCLLLSLSLSFRRNAIHMSLKGLNHLEDFPFLHAKWLLVDRFFPFIPSQCLSQLCFLWFLPV